MNAGCHLHLRSLRTGSSSLNVKDRTGGRKIPYGWGFDLVSCANYFWEIMAWTAFAGLTRAYTGKFS